MENHIQTVRSVDKKNNATYRHKSVEDFLSSQTIRSGINSIWEAGLPIDTLISLKQSQTLTVVLNGAADPDTRLPWLAGVGTTQGMVTSKLFVSDPSLYLGNGLGSAYYAGNRFQQNLQNALLKIIQKVATIAGAEHIVLLGGSSGGFAALALSHYLPNSTAVVFNPQTNLWSHTKRPVEKWLSIAWGLESLTGLPDTIDIDLINLYSKGFYNRIIYMQNETDKHYQQHYLPFLEGIGAGNFQSLVHNEAKGHTPPPKKMIRKVLEQAISTYPEGAINGFSVQ